MIYNFTIYNYTIYFFIDQFDYFQISVQNYNKLLKQRNILEIFRLFYDF